MNFCRFLFHHCEMTSPLEFPIALSAAVKHFTASLSNPIILSDHPRELITSRRCFDPYMPTQFIHFDI